MRERWIGPVCIRQGSKINDDSVIVEELDWSAESQVLIQLNTSFVTLNADLELKMYHQIPMIVHSLYGQKFWDTPFIRREKCTSKLWQQIN